MPPRIRVPHIHTRCLRRPYATKATKATTTTKAPPAPARPPSTTPATATARLPPPPPPAGAAKLTPLRRLISIAGVDATKYLQGLTTTNIPHRLSTAAAVGGGSGSGTYSAFLTPQVRSSDPGLYSHSNALLSYDFQKQGRVLFDVFIYPDSHSSSSNGDDPGYIIECDAESVGRLMAHLGRYKLRSKFTLRALEPGEMDAWAVWDDATPLQPRLAQQVQAGGVVGLLDTRSPGLGARVLLPAGGAPQMEVEHCGVDAYTLRRILHGVPEGQGEIQEGVALPLESCLDYMGGVDFDKGCYVGQELTVRTRHRGVVRKRVLPVQLYPAAETPPPALEYAPGVAVPGVVRGAEIRPWGKVGRAAGRWLGGVGNVGLALCRLEMMTAVRLEGGLEGWKEGDEFRIGKEGEGGGAVKVKAFVPGWHGR